MYYRLLIATFLSWLLTFSAWAQSKIAQQETQLMAYTQEGKYVEAMALSKQLARTYQQKGDTVKWLKTIFFQGSISYSTAEYLSAKKYYRNAYTIAVAKHSVPDYILFSLYHSLSTVYQDFHQTDSVKYFAYRTHELIRRFPDLPKRVPSYAIAFYISEGVRMYDEHNYQASNLYFSQVEKLLTLFNDQLYSALTKSQIGIALQKQGHFIKADSIFTTIVRTYRKEDTDRIWFLLAAAKIRLLMKDLPVAKVHIDGALALFQKLGQPNPDVEQYLHLRRGQLYAAQTQDSAAIGSLQKAISIANKHYGTRGSVPADAYKELSTIFARQGKGQAALNAIQQAVIATTAMFKDKNLAQNPSANDYVLGNQLFEALRLKAQLLAKDKPSLALQTHRRAIEVAFRLRREISSTESKLFFQQSRVDEVFAEALALAYQVGDSESFLWLMEQSQAATLGDLLSGNSLKASYLPPKVLEQEALLTSKITQLKMTLSQKADVKKETELQDAQLAMERFELELSQNYPKYVQAKLLDEKISIKGIQQQLAEDMAYVAFYVAKNRIFTLVINKQNVKILANSLNTSEYESQINALRKALDHDPKIGKYTGEKASHYLYKTLFAPIEKLLEGKTRLVISRNGKLNLIPLDVLEFAPKRYLVEKFAIGYAYNASLQFAKKSSAWGKPLLFVFAPFSKPSGQFVAARGDTLKYLPATVNECRKLGGTLYSNNHARKTTFLETQRQQAQQGGAAIFHFATHSVIDSLPEKSFVAFHPSDTQEFRLFTTEIQNLNLSNIKLAVLNSCSSAYGQLIENEGLLSLGRAFTQAGCKSVAAALWEQNDASGSEISVSFHQYLAAGLPTDIALQKAKLDYLKQPHADAFRDYRHPYYWGALLLMGDPTPVYNSTWWLPYLLVGVGTLLVLLLGLLFWKRMGR